MFNVPYKRRKHRDTPKQPEMSEMPKSSDDETPYLSCIHSALQPKLTQPKTWRDISEQLLCNTAAYLMSSSQCAHDPIIACLDTQKDTEHLRPEMFKATCVAVPCLSCLHNRSCPAQVKQCGTPQNAETLKSSDDDTPYLSFMVLHSHSHSSPTTRHGEQLLLGPTNPVTAARTWLVTQLQLFMACPGRKTQTIQTRYVQSAMGCGAMSILSTQLLIPCTHETVWHPAQHTKCPKSSDDDTPYLSCMVIHSHSSPTPSAQRCCLSDLFTAVCM